MRLDLVAEAKKNGEYIAKGGDLDITGLVGLGKGTIRERLGDPEICPEGSWSLCEEAGDWFYSFYELPENSLGGGPELLLRFSGGEICTGSRWAFTQ